MNDNGYINIQGWMINHLGIKGNELFIYALIYGFSQDGESEFYGSSRYIAKALGISRQSIMKLIQNLLEKELIVCTSESHYRAVKKVYQSNTVGGKESLPVGGKESLPVGGKESLPNIDNTTNKTINNNIGLSSPEVLRIFNWWNSFNSLVSHKVFSTVMKKQIKKRIDEGYTPEDLALAIQKYNTVLSGEGYWLTKRWTLLEFMKQENAMPNLLVKSISDYKQSKPKPTYE